MHACLSVCLPPSSPRPFPNPLSLSLQQTSEIASRHLCKQVYWFFLRLCVFNLHAHIPSSNQWNAFKVKSEPLSACRVCLRACLPLSLSACLHIYLFVYRSVCLPLWLPACLPVSLTASVCLFTCLLSVRNRITNSTTKTISSTLFRQIHKKKPSASVAVTEVSGTVQTLPLGTTLSLL